RLCREGALDRVGLPTRHDQRRARSADAPSALRQRHLLVRHRRRTHSRDLRRAHPRQAAWVPRAHALSASSMMLAIRTLKTEGYVDYVPSYREGGEVSSRPDDRPCAEADFESVPVSEWNDPSCAEPMSEPGQSTDSNTNDWNGRSNRSEAKLPRSGSRPTSKRHDNGTETSLDSCESSALSRSLTSRSA